MYIYKKYKIHVDSYIKIKSIFSPRVVFKTEQTDIMS